MELLFTHLSRVVDKGVLSGGTTVLGMMIVHPSGIYNHHNMDLYSKVGAALNM